MFADRLTTTLSLTVGSANFALIAGQIERFELDLRPWGFSAELVFYVNSEQEPDEVFEPFSGQELVVASFGLARETEDEDEVDTALKVTGYAVYRAVSEVVGERLKGAPVIGRRYQLRFVDPAQAFWTQHRPIELYAQASMQDLLDAHKPVGIEITYDWSALTNKLDVLAVALDGEAEPSFYDFVTWWIDRNQGVFEFDAASGAYRIAGKKSTGQTATAVDAEDIAAVQLLFPEPPRFNGRVLNPFADAPTTQALSNALAASGVRRDVVVRTPVAAEAEKRGQVESLRFRARPPGVELHYRRFPPTAPAPGALVSFEDGFSERAFVAGNTYRVTRLIARGEHKAGLVVEPEDSSNVYELELTVQAEERGSLVASLPPFVDPRRTLRVEGKIVSSGAAGKRTWAAIENEQNSLWMYKVQIPIFNKQIPAPFTPNFASGHFFFPAYKDQRVLVDIDFDRAAITGFLDWADEGRLPSDSQGNQIVLGFESGNGTVVRHRYENASPVLSIERKTSSETSTVVMGDGVLTISLQESTSIPTTIPLYDVSPQVDAAKDAVVGEVGGSVTEVTSQFETSVGQISSAIEETSAAVDSEIRAAERELGGKLDEVDTELSGMLADATAAVASVSMGVTRAKARLTTAVQSVEEVRAPLRALQTRLSQFRTTAGIRVAELKAEIGQVDQVIAAPLDALGVRALALREQAKNRLDSLQATIDTLGPKGQGGPFQQLLVLRQDVQGFEADLRQLPSRIEGSVDSFGQGITNDWAPLESTLSSLGNSATASFDRAARTVDERVQRVQASLQAKLGSTPSAALSARGNAARTRLSSVKQAADAALLAQRTAASDAIAVVQARVDSARTQARAGSAAVASTSKQAASALNDGVRSMLSALDQAADALTSAANTATSSLSSSVRTLRQAIIPALDAIPATIDGVKRTLQQAVQTARDALLSLLSSIDRLLSELDSAVQVPLKTAMATLDTAEQTALTTVNTTSATLDSTFSVAQNTLNTFVSSFEALVDGAGTALATVRALVKGARDTIMPPIDALASLVEQLQSIFQTGVNLLTAFIDSAHATLDAIPAASLPQAMVQPTITAITTALDAVLPLISAGAQTAGEQLSSMGTTLVGQVQTAENTALGAVSTFIDTIGQQIDAILPPVKEQMDAVQTQIDNAIEQVLEQLDQATTAAVSAITTTFDTAGAQAQTISSAAVTQLDNADAQLKQTVADVRAQIASQRSALLQQANTLISSASSTVDGLAQRLDQGVGSVQTAIENARTALVAQVDAVRSAQAPRLQQMRDRLQQIPTALDQQLAPLRARNRELVSQVSANMPKPGDFDDAAAVVTDPALAQCSTLEQEIARY